MTAFAAIEAVRYPHRNPSLVAWAATGLGRAAVLAAAGALLGLYDAWLAFQVVPLAGLVLVQPHLRSAALSLAGVAVLYSVAADKQVSFLDPAVPGAVFLPPAAAAIWVGALYLCFRAARKYASLPEIVRTYPQVCLHAVLWAVLAVAWFIPAEATGIEGVGRLAAACFPFLVWRCAYLLLAGRRGTAAGTRFRDHLYYLCPPWGGTSTPYGKGYDTLREAATETPEAVARAQMAGLKLLCLAWIWTGVDELLALAFGSKGLGLPRLATLVAAGTKDVALPVLWASLVVDLIRRVLAIAIAGHIVVGGLRLFGFYVLRNTYKPLLSESLVDFWSRYYYYFKELLVEFFFYPTYLAWFRRRPALRLYTAVFAAACLGNTYFHVLTDLPELARAGLAQAPGLLAPRVFYTALLAAGVAISMQRQRTLRGAGAAPPATGVRLRRIAGVWLFFAVINIWNVSPGEASFSACTSFFFSLLGWR